ncbi:MAG: hypothetical protein WBG24_14690, partial [Syntrophobacteria bacterium]
MLSSPQAFSDQLSAVSFMNAMRFALCGNQSTTVFQFVIPAKSGGGGREPGSRNSLIILNFRWILDPAR